MQKIIIVGSSNVDLTARVRTLPRPGETIGGATLHRANGGKGANQAVAAARLGADVTLITCLGKDASGKALAAQFAADGIDTSGIKFSDTPTGTALIFVDDNAENCIAVAPGSNDDLMPEDVEALRDVFANAGYLRDSHPHGGTCRHARGFRWTKDCVESRSHETVSEGTVQPSVADYP